MSQRPKPVQKIFNSVENWSEEEIKLIFFLIKTAELRKQKRTKISKANEQDLKCEIIQNLKKGALGFKIGCFDDFEIQKMKSRVELHIFDIVFQIYQNGNIYKKLRNSKNMFLSKTHLNFYFVVDKELCEYEKCVVKQNISEGILSFYLGMWKASLNLQFINQINECFRDNPKNPFSFLKLYGKDGLNGKFSFSNDLIYTCTRHINKLTNDFINTGTFDDISNEFYILKNNKGQPDYWDHYMLDYGLLPFLIEKNTAEKILYIGKSVYILNLLKEYKTSHKLNIVDRNYDYELSLVIKETNQQLYKKFIINIKVLEYLENAKNIFLFSRSDFVETLSFLFRDYTISGNKILLNKSISYLLENALRDTFGPPNDFISKIDICILENENSWDYISLYCQLDFPINLFFTKEVIMKFVSMFKFLWRLKKIESLLRQLKKKNFETKSKIRIIEYLNLINRLYYYIFEEVIENEYKFKIENNNLMIDELRKSINLVLDEILIKSFQITKNGKEELYIFLNSLENLCMSLSNTEIIQICDVDVRRNLNDFIKNNSKSAIVSTLVDLHLFV